MWLLVQSVIWLCLLLLLRLIYLVWKIRGQRLGSAPMILPTLDHPDSASMMAVLGSGGHTKELISLLEHLGDKFYPRAYIVAHSDSLSVDKITEMQHRLNDTRYIVFKLPRSREVQQSYKTSVYTTLKAICFAIPLVFKLRPNVLVCNGPGTCIPVWFAAFLLRLLFIQDVRVVFIESICRVTTISLSGKLLYYFVDSFIVQWPELASIYPMANYIGRLQ